MSDTTSLIAIGREPKRRIFYECGTWFLIRPAHSSREFSVFAEERRALKGDINYMAFVSNDHVLTQFKKVPEKDKEGKIISLSELDKPNKKSKKTIVFEANGMIKPQSKEV
jgi:hypothetical protein